MAKRKQQTASDQPPVDQTEATTTEPTLTPTNSAPPADTVDDKPASKSAQRSAAKLIAKHCKLTLAHASSIARDMSESEAAEVATNTLEAGQPERIAAIIERSQQRNAAKRRDAASEFVKRTADKSKAGKGE